MDFDTDMVQRLKNRLGEQLKRMENSSEDTLEAASLPSMPSEDREDQDHFESIPNPNVTQPQHSNPSARDASDLLEEAFIEIKNERAISQKLRDELQKVEQAAKFDQEEMIMLRQQVETLREIVEPMKKKICELSLTASFAIEQLAVFRIRDRSKSEPPPPPPPPPPAHPYPVHFADHAPPPVDHYGGHSSSRQPPLHPAPTASAPTAAPAPPVSSKSHQQHKDHLMERMRRAFAPPPKETMGLLVNSMVQELRRVLRERGSVLPLERVGDCVFMMGKKKVNLAVSGGKLVVKSGGGHHDFIAYLEKYMSSASAKRAHGHS